MTDECDDIRVVNLLQRCKLLVLFAFNYILIMLAGSELRFHNNTGQHNSLLG